MSAGFEAWRTPVDDGRSAIPRNVPGTSEGEQCAEPPGPGLPELPAYEDDLHSARRLVLTAASDIRPRRVIWAWLGRIALGTLALLAGPEGLGKSTLAYWIAARLTCGDLPGEHFGRPRAVLVCAAEDSWEHTIVPRLMAAGADLTRVFRVEMVTADDITTGLSLPRDLVAVERAARETDAALLILDPLMSRLADNLDTHRDGDVRRALEPLVAVADRTRMAIVGLIHHNKSGSSDPLQLVMASKAFTAVARSVSSVIKDPDDETDVRRLFGTPKNNLGPLLPTLAFTIVSHPIDTDDGPTYTGRLVWSDETVPGTIGDAMRRAAASDDDRSATSEAASWLGDYLTLNGGTVASADAKHDGKEAGHSESALKRARRTLCLAVTDDGFPRRSYWSTPVGPQSGQSARGDDLTGLTGPTGAYLPRSAQSGQSGQSGQPPEDADPTAPPDAPDLALPIVESALALPDADGIDPRSLDPNVPNALPDLALCPLPHQAPCTACTTTASAS